MSEALDQAKAFMALERAALFAATWNGANGRVFLHLDAGGLTVEALPRTPAKPPATTQLTWAEMTADPERINQTMLDAIDAARMR